MTGPGRWRPKATAFRLALLGIITGVIILGDWSLGLIHDIGIRREHSRLFREEVAFLRFDTRNFVPEIEHYYHGIMRPEGESLMPEVAPRVFRTDKAGAIIGEDKSGAITILFLGGSTTESNEVDEPFRFPAVSERLLRKAGASVKVINAGVRGHTTQDSINALLNRPAFRDADIVVIMHNINDRLKLALKRVYGASLGTDAPTSGKAVRNAFYGLLISLWDWASYRSNALFILRTELSRMDPFIGDQGGVVVNERSIDFRDPDIVMHIAEFERNLRILVTSVRILGKTPVLMTQPLGVESVEQERFNEVIKSVASTEKVHLIDLRHQLGPQRQWAFLSDNIHMNNSGSAVVGEIVATELAPLVGTTKLIDKDTDLGAINPSKLVKRCLASTGGTPTPGQIRLVLGKNGRYPSFSPDGRFMLFQTLLDGLERLAAFDTVEERYLDLSPLKSRDNERHPAFLNFTNDGFRVVYGSSKGKGTFETLMIRTWPVLTTEVLPLGEIGGAIPAVSSKAIFFPGFTSSGPDSTPNLYRFELITESVDRITTANSEQWRPALAPDGTIYFIDDRAGNFDIHRVKPGGLSELFFGTDHDEWDPAVSPDGRWLAFASRKDGSWDVYVKSLDGHDRLIKVTSGAGDEWDPYFDPTGRMLVFAASSGSEPQIFGLCLNGEQK